MMTRRGWHWLLVRLGLRVPDDCACHRWSPVYEGYDPGCCEECS